MSIVVDVISEYLRTNRRLVVPAFGAFMVKESGERVFSDLLRNDDGVLASLLRNRGLNEMEAAVTIDRFIFEMRHDLEMYGYYRLGEVGTLRIEPDTKVLRLYPPVQGEMPKAKPYIPQPVVEEKMVEVVPEVKVPAAPSVPKASETPIVPNAPKTPALSKKSIRPRKKLDFVMVVAIVIVLVAVVAIGYGWYVSTLAEGDDAAMDALRVVPEQTLK